MQALPPQPLDIRPRRLPVRQLRIEGGLNMTQRHESVAWPETKKRGRNGICRRCGEPNAMNLAVIAQGLVRAGHPYKAGTSITLCEEHGRELYEAIAALVEDNRRVI